MRSRNRHVAEALACGIAVIAATFCVVPVSAELVQISVPAVVSFTVPDVGTSAQGSPNPTTIAFVNAVLLPGHALRISVKAEGNLTGPGGSIAASKVSWTTSNVQNGVASNGQLSPGGYRQIFQGQADAMSGGLDVAWTLAALGGAPHAGVYQVTLRWKLEAITP
jgi:hypothetical protein